MPTARQVAGRLRTLVVFSTALLMAASCASHKVNELSPFIFDETVYRIEKDGIVIGVKPHFDTEAIERVFYVDMSKAGFYPIRLSISNLTSDRLVIDRGEIHLFTATGDKYAAVFSEDIVEELRHNSVAYGIFGFGVFSFMDAEKANAEMKADWSSKELPRTMLFGRGHKQTGFVYFRLPETVRPEATTLQITAEKFTTGDKVALRARLAARNQHAGS